MEAANENAVASRPKQWVARVKESFGDTKAEMKKVTWPGKNEVVSTTIVVLISTIVFAVFLWGCDELFGRGILWLLNRFGVSA